MKHVLHYIFIGLVVVGLIGNVWQTVFAEELPEYVQKQSRKDAVESETWKKFDQSGPVKFLQVQDTAAASEAGTGGKLDGSVGERLIEVKVIDPAGTCEKVEWTLENKGPSEVWIVVGTEEPPKIDAEGSATLETPLVEGYCYIVVDNEGGQETQLNIKAKCGDTEAKTARGNAMAIVWF